MSARGTPPVFLERQNYRRRRMMDAARLLPFLATVLFMLPLLWRGPTGGEGGGVPTSRAYLYLFAIWALLILASGLLARSARHWRGAGDAGDGGDRGGGG